MQEREQGSWCVHILHALEQVINNIEVRIVDTEIVTIPAGTFYELPGTQPLADIWVAFGMGKK